MRKAGDHFVQRHRRLLRLVAVVGVGAAVLGAQPIALVIAGVRSVPSGGLLDVVGPLHDATGVLGGLGYAATIALVLWLLFPRVWIALIGAAWSLAMALSRTALSVHWLTDTVGGLFVGAAAAFLVGALLLPWVRDRVDEPETVARVE